MFQTTNQAMFDYKANWCFILLNQYNVGPLDS